MKKLLLFALTISMLAITNCSKNDEDNSVVPIPDPVFKAYLLERHDNNNNGELSFTEVHWINQIWIEDASAIKSFEGIEYFTELNDILIKNCNLNSLNISKNTNLISIILDNVEIASSVDFSKNVNLTWISYTNSKLTSIDVSKNEKLENLYCGGNELAELDVSKNLLLIDINCSNNQLTELDVSKNISLTHLDCSSNNLTHLDLRFNINLWGISCYNNNIINLILILGHDYDMINRDHFTNIIYI